MAKERYVPTEITHSALNAPTIELELVKLTALYTLFPDSSRSIIHHKITIADAIQRYRRRFGQGK